MNKGKWIKIGHHQFICECIRRDGFQLNCIEGELYAECIYCGKEHYIPELFNLLKDQIKKEK